MQGQALLPIRILPSFAGMQDRYEFVAWSTNYSKESIIEELHIILKIMADWRVNILQSVLNLNISKNKFLLPVLSVAVTLICSLMQVPFMHIPLQFHDKLSVKVLRIKCTCTKALSLFSSSGRKTVGIKAHKELARSLFTVFVWQLAPIYYMQQTTPQLS